MGTIAADSKNLKKIKKIIKKFKNTPEPIFEHFDDREDYLVALIEYRYQVRLLQEKLDYLYHLEGNQSVSLFDFN